MITSCPSQDTLRHYLLGTCDAAASEHIEQHLNECDSCEQAVATIDGVSDSLLRHLPLAAAVRAEPAEPCRGWLARLREQPPRGEPLPLSSSDESELGESADQRFNYELLGTLGQGGMGIVYRARHRQLNRPVALKVLSPRLLAADEAQRRFEREIRILGSLKHPGIVMATDAGRIGGAAYLVMELVEGADLARLVRRDGPFTVAEACETVQQMAEALAAAHEVGAIHRDVKPSNAMIDRAGRVKVLDFGLACLSTPSAEYAETSVGRLLGTLEYMAPEQIEEGAPSSIRADLYALGATLFYLLTGRPPHPADPHQPVLAQLRAIANTEAPRISAIRAGVPAPVDNLIARLLSRNPADRPTSAREVARELTPWAGADLTGLVAHIEPAIENPATARQSLSKLLEEIATSLPLDDSPPSHPVPVKSKSNGGRGRKWLTLLAAAAGAAAVIVAFVVVLIRTSEGTLRIESEVANVRVELVDENDDAREWTIEKGENETTLRAGRYRVRLAGEHDGVTLDRDSVVIRRGDAVLARVTRTAEVQTGAATGVFEAPPTAASSSLPPETPSSPEAPLYEGLPEPVWLQRMRAEQSPLAKIEAANALLVFTSALPPEKRIDRIVEIGGQLVDAGWGSHHLLFVAYGASLAGESRNQVRWRMTKELTKAFIDFTDSVGLELAQAPPSAVAERLAYAVLHGNNGESSFAARQLRERTSSLAADAKAKHVVLSTLNVPLTGLNQSAAAAQIYAEFAPDAPDAIERFRELGQLLLREPLTPANSGLRYIWLSHARQIPAEELAARLIFDEILRFGTIGVHSRFTPEQSSTGIIPSVQTDGREHLYRIRMESMRKQVDYFVAYWPQTVNEYLLRHDRATVSPHLRAILFSLDYLLQMQHAKDAWELDETAELLTPYLRSLYLVGEEPEAESPETLLPVSAIDLLSVIVQVTGEIPDFVRNGRTCSAEVARQLASLENLLSKHAQLTEHAPSGNYEWRSEALPLIRESILQNAPYEFIRILADQKTEVASQILHLYHPSRDEAAAILAILLDLAGTSEERDTWIAVTLRGRPNERPHWLLEDITPLFTGPWKFKLVVDRQVQAAAERSKSRALTETLHELLPIN